MLLADVVASFFGLVFVAVVVGIPISIAVANNRRHAEATRYAHMNGWAHGTPLATAHRYQGTPSGTPGPHIVAFGTGPTAKAIRIVNGPPPPRPDPAVVGGHPQVVVPRPGPGEDEAAFLVEPAASSIDGALPQDDVRRASVDRDQTVIFVPPVPTPPPAGTAEAQVLGHPQVLGWAEMPPRLRISTELCCYLALHFERPMSQDECRTALGSGDGDKPDAAVKTVRNAIWALRQGLGRDLVPDGTKTGYQLSEKVTTDWKRFEGAVASEKPGSPGELDALISALVLVRGAPFEGVAAGSFAWAWSELWVPRMETAIIDVARRAASLALAVGEPDKASWAALQGLLAVPNDIQLWTAHLESAAARGRVELERATDHARSVLGEEFGQLPDGVSGIEE